MELKNTVLGIELGSTRIKAVLLSKEHVPLASGSHEWENRLSDGFWTYSLADVHSGLRACYAALKRDVRERLGLTLTTVGAIGISAMMHGYLPFDQNGRQLAEFRTWRNTVTGQAAAELSECFAFNIPQRWSIAHLYQAILNGETHTKELAFFTTLSGYIHWQLTGEKNIGIGDASGMFPIDSQTLDYDERMVALFDALAVRHGFFRPLRTLLPRVLTAGCFAGRLTAQGAALLDPEGDLQPGVPLVPCEGDAGTGMAATNAVRLRTGNVSAGTSDFAMLVTDRPLAPHREIDMVTTPAGLPVAMVHCNNCTSDINAWISLFGEFASALGVACDKGKLFSLLFRKALEGDADCGGLVGFNYFSGEGVTDLDEGRPLFLRRPDSAFTLANFMRMHLLSALATLKLGLDILTGEEGVAIDRLTAHGGFFKTPEVGQRLLSAAVAAPVSVMETAGEGGPYGMALLAAFALWRDEGETLEEYLAQKVFPATPVSTLMAEEEEIRGFAAFLSRYQKALPLERAATEVL